MKITKNFSRIGGVSFLTKNRNLILFWKFIKSNKIKEIGYQYLNNHKQYNSAFISALTLKLRDNMNFIKKIKTIFHLNIEDYTTMVPISIKVEKIDNGFILYSGRRGTEKVEYYLTPQEFKQAIFNIINDEINNL